MIELKGLDLKKNTKAHKNGAIIYYYERKTCSGGFMGGCYTEITVHKGKIKKDTGYIYQDDETRRAMFDITYKDQGEIIEATVLKVDLYDSATLVKHIEQTRRDNDKRLDIMLKANK